MESILESSIDSFVSDIDTLQSLYYYLLVRVIVVNFVASVSGDMDPSVPEGLGVVFSPRVHLPSLRYVPRPSYAFTVYIFKLVVEVCKGPWSLCDRREMAMAHDGRRPPQSGLFAAVLSRSSRPTWVSVRMFCFPRCSLSQLQCQLAGGGPKDRNAPVETGGDCTDDPQCAPVE